MLHVTNKRYASQGVTWHSRKTETMNTSALLSESSTRTISKDTYYSLKLDQSKAIERLTKQGNWPTRSESFSAEDASYDFVVMAAFQTPKTYGDCDQPMLDYPALANYLGAPQESFDHLFYEDATPEPKLKRVKATHVVKKCVTVQEVAEQISMSIRWLKDQVKAGNLKGYRLGIKIMIDLESLKEFMAAREMAKKG